MASSSSLMNRIMAFFRSPQGRRVVDQGRRQLQNPRTQQRLRSMLSRRGRR